MHAEEDRALAEKESYRTMRPTRMVRENRTETPCGALVKDKYSVSHAATCLRRECVKARRDMAQRNTTQGVLV